MLLSGAAVLLSAGLAAAIGRGRQQTNFYPAWHSHGWRSGQTSPWEAAAAADPGPEVLDSPVPPPIYSTEDAVMSDAFANVLINLRRWARRYPTECSREGRSLILYAKRMVYDIGFCSGPITYRQFNNNKRFRSATKTCYAAIAHKMAGNTAPSDYKACKSSAQAKGSRVFDFENFILEWTKTRPIVAALGIGA